MVRSRTPLRLTGKPRCPSRKQKMGYRVPLDRSVQPPHPAAMPRLYTSLADFWPFYLRAHSKARTRALHYVAPSLVVLIAVAAAAAGRRRVFAGLPVAGLSSMGRAAGRAQGGQVRNLSWDGGTVQK